MARGKMSAAAKRAISRAQKARWAEYRKMKARGEVPAGAKRPSGKLRKRRGRRGRRPGGTLASGSLPAGGMTGQHTSDLVAMRRRIDQELADRYVREYQTA